MIQINNLQKKFGAKTAVNIDNYIINQGDMLGLVGNNGAGKTTLFRLILDLLEELYRRFHRRRLPDRLSHPGRIFPFHRQDVRPEKRRSR